MLNLMILPFVLISGGWAISTLWNWFAVPQFGVPALSIATTIGLRILLTLIREKPLEIRPDDEVFESGVKWILVYSISVGVGWIILRLSA